MYIYDSTRRQLLTELQAIKREVAPYTIPLAVHIHNWACSFLDDLNKREWEGKEADLRDTYNPFLIEFLQGDALSEAARIAPNGEVFNPSVYHELWRSDPSGFCKKFHRGAHTEFRPAKNMLRSVARYARSHFPDNFQTEQEVFREEELWVAIKAKIEREAPDYKGIFEKKTNKMEEIRRRFQERILDSWSRIDSEEKREHEESIKTEQERFDEIKRNIGVLHRELQEANERCDVADQAMDDLNRSCHQLETVIEQCEKAQKKAKKQQNKKLAIQIAVMICAPFAKELLPMIEMFTKPTPTGERTLVGVIGRF